MITNSIISLTIRRQTYLSDLTPPLFWKLRDGGGRGWPEKASSPAGRWSGNRHCGTLHPQTVEGLFTFQIRDACFSYAGDTRTSLFHHSSGGGNPWSVTLTINSTELEMEIETGSARTIVSRDTFDRLLGGQKLEETTTVLRTCHS